MSSLWKTEEAKQLKTYSKRPSPKQISDNPINAQIYFLYIFLNKTIKGISLFISKSKKVKASMTVEAAVVLPLFLLFFLSLGSAIEMIRLHGNMEFALSDIGNSMAVYGYALTSSGQEGDEPEASRDEQGNEWLAELSDIAFSYTYVKESIVEYLGREYLETSPIVKGVNGLQFPESNIFGEEDCFEIVVTYKVAPFGEIVGFKGFRMANRYYAHIWNGYHIPGTEDAETDVVYVAEHGIVYHIDEACTHLFLTVREVSLKEAYESRNSNGEKYDLCRYCEKSDINGLVYITEDGDRIHYKRNCTGLKRTVYKISREEAKNYLPCSRCVKIQ